MINSLHLNTSVLSDLFSCCCRCRRLLRPRHRGVCGCDYGCGSGWTWAAPQVASVLGIVSGSTALCSLNKFASLGLLHVAREGVGESEQRELSLMLHRRHRTRRFPARRVTRVRYKRSSGRCCCQIWMMLVCATESSGTQLGSA